MSDIFQDVLAEVRETALLEATRALLEWDERTGLPSQAGEYRAQQITLLSGIIHRRKTNPRFGEQLAELSASELAQEVGPTSATISVLSKDYERNRKLPLRLVQELSTATVLGQQAWERSRAADDWKQFEPHMERIYALRREEAELLQTTEGTLYDALLDQYEDGARSEQLTTIFATLRDALVALVRRLDAAPRPPTGDSWRRAVPVENQRQISRWIAEKIGYCFERGRLDETSHPFCTTLGPNDCRILTRYQLDYFPSGFYGTLHEAGHGLYEQGLPTQWYGLPPGTYASLGVHESQSRLWENFVGRSREFWQWCFPHLKSQVAGAWDALSPNDLYQDANRVTPSLIRVEADEVTYNLHILIRFEIEQELMTGQLSVADAPTAWNERYEHYLGIRPASNRDGILQDVHWSAGLVGYFPTYTLGNLYAAQLMQAAERDLGDLPRMIAVGEFSPLLEWLRVKIHAHGFCYHPGQLIKNAVGQELSAQPLVDYLSGKLIPLYGL
ncbi:MAG: carboxypeptidase M32 [Pirellulaceae bacterium]